MKKIGLCIGLLSTTLLLQGCLGGVFVAGAATGGTVIDDKRDMNTIVDDRTIAYNAGIRIAKDPDLKNRCHIVVSAFDRVVLLTGQAENETLRDSALSKIQSIPRVKRVYNEITISPQTSTLTRSSDSWITTKVRTEMLLAKELKSSHVKVVTENSTVYLLGMVTPKQGRLASTVARRVAGVQRVVKLFEYLSVAE